MRIGCSQSSPRAPHNPNHGVRRCYIVPKNKREQNGILSPLATPRAFFLLIKTEN